MTLQRLEVMNRAWKRLPPQHVSTAKIYALFSAWLGIKESTSLPENNHVPDFVTLPDIVE